MRIARLTTAVCVLFIALPAVAVAGKLSAPGEIALTLRATARSRGRSGALSSIAV